MNLVDENVLGFIHFWDSLGLSWSFYVFLKSLKMYVDADTPVSPRFHTFLWQMLPGLSEIEDDRRLSHGGRCEQACGLLLCSRLDRTDP